jgi:D-aspartate ligase
VPRVEEKTTRIGNTQKKEVASGCRRERVGAIIIGGNFQGLGVLRSLARQKVPICLLDQGLCIGRFSRYTNKFLKCPDVRQEALFFHFLTELARKENLRGWVVYPNDDETVRFLAKHKEPLEEYYRLVTPSWDIVRFAYDKRLTGEVAERCGIAIPRTFYPQKTEELEQLDIGFPAIIKPSVKEPFYSRTERSLLKNTLRRVWWSVVHRQ